MSSVRRDGLPHRRSVRADGAAFLTAGRKKDRTYPELAGHFGQAKLVVLECEVGGRWSTRRLSHGCWPSEKPAQKRSPNKPGPGQHGSCGGVPPERATLRGLSKSSSLMQARPSGGCDGPTSFHCRGRGRALLRGWCCLRGWCAVIPWFCCTVSDFFLITQFRKNIATATASSLVPFCISATAPARLLNVALCVSAR